MEKKLDSIYSVYMDDLSKESTRNARTRIHWICKETVGLKILDVGCSQGITTLLLGREGKTVLGLDVEQESIDFANQKLELENVGTQKRVHFVADNFLTYPFEQECFDTIILTEVLEHIVNVVPFLKKADDLLDQKGKLIITVPFGINDFWDHKETYYVSELYELLSGKFDICTIRFFTKWIGFVCTKHGMCERPVPVNLELLRETEKCFYSIERGLVDQCSRLRDTIAKNKTQANIREDKLIQEKKKLESELSNLNEEKSLLESDKSECQVVMKQLQEINADKIKENIELNRLLQETKEQLEKNTQRYKRDVDFLQDQYNDLANSKLGRLTIKIWNWRNKNKIR